MRYNTKLAVENLTLDKILKYVNELSIYRHYLNEKVILNKPMCSPLREDKNPSWSLFIGRNGRILYKDYATNDSGDIIKLIRNIFNITIKRALERIWRDLVVNDTSRPLIPQTLLKESVNGLKTHISVKRKYFTKKDIEYWGNYGITKKVLQYFNVYPISMFWVNDKQNRLLYTNKQPMYAYQVYNKYKIYRPYSLVRADKWRNNCDLYDLQGLPQLKDNNDLLIITKALKDVMVLHTFGYSAIAAQSEVANIPSIVIKHLKSRFKHIVVFYDNDESGIKGATKLTKKYKLNKVFISKHYLDLYGIKDISDFRAEMGEKETHRILKELFNENN